MASYYVGDGSDSSLTVSGATTENSVNSNITTQANSGQKNVILASASGFSAKDWVFISQDQGTEFGLYEFNQINSIDGSTLTLFGNLKNTYQSTGARVFLVKQYSSVTVQGTGTWSGSQGTIVAMVTGNVTINTGGIINLNGVGHGGGAAEDGAQGTPVSSWTGASPTGVSLQQQSANGSGGGGGYVSSGGVSMAGGGGGGHGAGGVAGDSGLNGTGGAGGGTSGDATMNSYVNRGSGGGGGVSGAGAGSNPGAGGGGAGRLILAIGGNFANSGTTRANGNDGGDYGGQYCGGGGAGSGGGIRVICEGTVTCGTLTATGGTGGLGDPNYGIDGGNGAVGRIATLAGSTVSGSSTPTINESSTDTTSTENPYLIEIDANDSVSVTEDVTITKVFNINIFDSVTIDGIINTDPLLDQFLNDRNDICGWDSYSLQDSYYWGQVFVTGAGVTNISKIKVGISRESGDGDVTLDVYATDVNHKPTGASLGSKVLTSAEIPVSELDWAIFAFSSQIEVSDETEYCLVIKSPNTNTPNKYFFSLDSCGGYINGGMLYSANAGSSWSYDSTEDMEFETYFNFAPFEINTYDEITTEDNVDVIKEDTREIIVNDEVSVTDVFIIINRYQIEGPKTNWAYLEQSANRSIARDSNGYLYAVYNEWNSGLSAYTIRCSRSIDEGQNWTQSVVHADGSYYQYTPKIAIDSSDNIYIVWEGKGSPSNPTITNISYKKGTWDSWGSRIIITDDSVYQYVPGITIDSSDNVHFTWYGHSSTVVNTGYYQIRYVKLTGESLGSITDLTDSTFWMYDPAIAIDSSNNIHIVWYDKTSYYDIYYIKSSDGGASWGSIENVTTSSANHYAIPSIATDSNDDVHICYRSQLSGDNTIIYRKRTTSWQAEETVSSIGGETPYNSIALDANDNIYIVFSKRMGTAPTQVVLRKKISGSWQPEHVITYETTYQNRPTLLWATHPVSGGQPNITEVGCIGIWEDSTGTGASNFSGSIELFYDINLEYQVKETYDIDISDILSITELASTSIHLGDINVFDNIAIQESTDEEKTLYIIVNDTQSSTENITLENIQLGNINISDNQTVAGDVLIANIQLGDISVNHTQSIVENITLENTQLGGIDIYDSLTITESRFAQPSWDVIDALVGRWRMNELSWDGSIDEVVDLTNYRNDGIAVGGVSTNANGKLNRCGGLFDGIDDYVDCGEDASLNLTNAITIELWVKPTVSQEVCYIDPENKGNVGIAAKVTSATGSATWSWQLRYGSPDSCRLGIQLNTVAYGAQWATAQQDLTTNEWSHVVCTFDGTNIKFYIDSVLKDTNVLDGATTIVSNLNKLLICSDGWSESTEYFDGYIDNFRLYNRALTPTEINGLYNQGVGTEEASSEPNVASNDLVNITENIGIIQLNNININDEQEVTENITGETTNNINTYDQITVNENVVSKNIKLGDVSVYDNISIQESIIEAKTLFVNVFDNQEIIENSAITNIQLGDIGIFDTLNIAEDIVNAGQSGNISVNDEQGTTEDITIESIQNTNIYDDLILTENVVVLRTPDIPWSDAFDDNNFDTTKWVESTNVGSLVAEQNNRLELISNATTSGFVRSIGSYVPKNTQLIIKVLQHCNDGGFKLCPTIVVSHEWDVYSENNWYNFQLIASGVLSPNVKDDGVMTQVGDDSGSLTPPYWMRMRIDDTTIYFDYAEQTDKPTEGEWTNISSETWDMGTGINQEQYVYLTAYNTPTIGELYYANFSWSLLEPSPNVDNSISITEDVSIEVEDVTDLIVNVFDNVPIQENIEEVGELEINIFDNQGVTESVTIIEIEFINVYDEVTLSEDINKVSSLFIITFDNIPIQESTTELKTLFININTEQGVVESIITQNTQLGNISVNDNVEITENVERSSVQNIDAYNNQEITENVAITNIQLGGIDDNDSIVILENITIENVELNISAYDNVLIQESAEELRILRVEVYEEQSIIDNTVISNIQLGDIEVFDAISIQEIIEKLRTLFISITEEINITENVVPENEESSVSLYDVIFIIENIIGENTEVNVNIFDNVPIQENVEESKTTFISITDEININEDTTLTNEQLSDISTYDEIIILENVNTTQLPDVDTYDDILIEEEVISKNTQLGDIDGSGWEWGVKIYD